MGPCGRVTNLTIYRGSIYISNKILLEKFESKAVDNPIVIMDII
jgi:hypothetical protein